MEILTSNNMEDGLFKIRLFGMDTFSDGIFYVHNMIIEEIILRKVIIDIEL
ncbi:MAG: hypothetical protein AB2375_05045 [Tissierellaceae bacterium]